MTGVSLAYANDHATLASSERVLGVVTLSSAAPAALSIGLASLPAAASPGQAVGLRREPGIPPPATARRDGRPGGRGATGLSVSVRADRARGLLAHLELPARHHARRAWPGTLPCVQCRLPRGVRQPRPARCSSPGLPTSSATRACMPATSRARPSPARRGAAVRQPAGPGRAAAEGVSPACGRPARRAGTAARDRLRAGLLQAEICGPELDIEIEAHASWGGGL